MQVTFISQCQKNALPKTRRILDAFADRIGERTWQTRITQEGLLAVKNLLRRNASKNTAVACHYRRNYKQNELLWIVGSRDSFNAEGIVPVNWTHKNHLVNDWQHNWHYLPLVQHLAALAALLHDWGKANAYFQDKLNPEKTHKHKSDPLRHEWVSCILLKALIQQANSKNNLKNNPENNPNLSPDWAWLEALKNQTWEEKLFSENNFFDINNIEIKKPLHELPPLARAVAWLIVTHHRLPILKSDNSYTNREANKMDAVFEIIDSSWSYENPKEKLEQAKCFVFNPNLLSQSDIWQDNLRKSATKLLENLEKYQNLLENKDIERVVLHHARLALMLGDHFYSSQTANPKKQAENINLYANTDPKTKQLKQKLDEHLIGVSQEASQVARTLPHLATKMRAAENLHELDKKSTDSKYQWQDRAVEKIKQYRKTQPESPTAQGFFLVNMASTGCGKTIANAKIMRALSEDQKSLRFVLALGLRTLTLQTGDEYRERLGLDSGDLGVLIGSAASQQLHELNQDSQKNAENQAETLENMGSESSEDLLDEDFSDDLSDLPEITENMDFLKILFEKNKKNYAFLHKPILACTIDHLMAATETTRGGKYILPSLRLLSSDVVMDEIDDFGEKDLVAIGRLVHLIGMLGRKLMISSATIPPDLAQGLFHAYQTGWRQYCAFMGLDIKTKNNIIGVWIDEFSTYVKTIENPENPENYQDFHKKFIETRCANIKNQEVKDGVKRRGALVDFKLDTQPIETTTKLSRSERLKSGQNHPVQNQKPHNTPKIQYFQAIQAEISKLHKAHHSVDEKTKKKVSFGVVRMANITPCVQLAQYLLEADWDKNHAPKIMAYHSRQVLVLRAYQEAHLDQVLKRKNPKQVFENKIIREHLDRESLKEIENIIFILVATPVEEVGRDHDLDWAIIEPSSYRSIIQMAGRVRRHRGKLETDQANIHIMPFNLRYLKDKSDACFIYPGYENSDRKLATHDLREGLIEAESLENSINAIPRIQKPQVLAEKSHLADLEHFAMQETLMQFDNKKTDDFAGWLDSYWWMTALPQVANRFRAGAADEKLKLAFKEDRSVFQDELGDPIEDSYKINWRDAPKNPERLWLKRKYTDVLLHYMRIENPSFPSAFEELRWSERDELAKMARRLGEIMLPKYLLPQPNKLPKKLEYCDDFGLCAVKNEI